MKAKEKRDNEKPYYNIVFEVSEEELTRRFTLMVQHFINNTYNLEKIAKNKEINEQAHLKLKGN